MIKLNKIYNEDCLIGMNKMIEQGIKVDLILCDLPYGEKTDKTRAKWDSTIDLTILFDSYKKLIKDKGIIVLFGNEPFSSYVRFGLIELYKYDIKWIKSKTTGFANANYRPMNKYEDIIVFSKANASTGGRKNAMTYNPQNLIQVDKKKKNSKNRHGIIMQDTNNTGDNNSLLQEGTEYIQKYTNYPQNVIYFDNEKKYVHPTQKPVSLCEYLIKTYTNKGEIVLDNCMGSGTTAIACINTNRNYIGFELDKKYYNISQQRINDTYKELN